MSGVDLYNRAYSSFTSELYRKIRVATYGEDFGQTSWVTNEESARIPDLLKLSSDSSVLEIGSGSGKYAMHLARSVGCHILGFDLNGAGVETANALSASEGLQSLARFEQRDVSEKLALRDAMFDAVFANDVLCHIPGRLNLLREMFRVLKPGGRMLFSDALVIGGMISHEELATRSSIGYYVFSPPGENERLIAAAGFAKIAVSDTTSQAARVAERWQSARAEEKQRLVELEGEENFEGLQRFLSCVHKLTSERRLLRCLYSSERPQ